MHDFDRAIHLDRLHDDTFRGATHAAYANMVGPFGGATGAVLLNAAMLHPARQGDPVALTVNFAAPIAEGAFDVVARPARTNRSTQHWVLSLEQEGAIVATATAVLALRSPSWSAAEAVPPRDMPPVDAVTPMPALGRFPWVRQYDFRFVEGELTDAFDGTEQAHSRSCYWIRDEPARPLDFLALTALCDSFFPRTYVRRRYAAPAGTVSMTTYFHADADMLRAQGERHVQARAAAVNFRNGYFDQSGEVWNDQGALLASTHQMVYFRD